MHIALAVFFLVFIPAQGLAQNLFKLEGPTQGTSYHLTYAGDEQADLQSRIHAELARFDTIYSNYRPDSSISRFNNSPSLDWVPVDRELAELVQNALKISAATQGTFDITAGEISRVWGFAPFSREKGRIPSEAEIGGALFRSGYQKLEVRLDPPALKRKIGGLKVDLSGFAQGHAVDRIAALLNETGISSYTIEIGGELYARGLKPDGKPWRIALESPIPENEESEDIAGIVSLTDAALSTSGTYRSSLIKKGKSYAHIMDVRLGRPVQVEAVSASVIAPTCREADAFAKAFLMLDPPTLESVAAKFHLSALRMIETPKGQRLETIGKFPEISQSK